MEKKGVAAVASFVAVALLAGILLGGTVARPPPVTITAQVTIAKTVTVAETTVEIPIRHQPVVYAAEAQTTCIFIVDCERVAAVLLRVARLVHPVKR
jgi:hypothetical protein